MRKNKRISIPKKRQISEIERNRQSLPNKVPIDLLDLKDATTLLYTKKLSIEASYKNISENAGITCFLLSASYKQSLRTLIWLLRFSFYQTLLVTLLEMPTVLSLSILLSEFAFFSMNIYGLIHFRNKGRYVLKMVVRLNESILIIVISGIALIASVLKKFGSENQVSNGL